ncbi:TrmH family RNA methyltransferase [Klebsiella pneumoniae subsp. pneumoniae]|uniref:TrmH family RNA methyltransferase n=2 Tax=Klebsiella pneumoniae TaxID=573 RepID=A0A378AHU5_KLEPN|nr:TrmH family RNA methyltransferase [Klebsiella pneumoniae subsp. pneumoniae]
MNHTALVFGREDAGLTNEELALADVLTGVPMAADYPSLNLGQSVMVYCYQLASLMQQTAPPPLRQTIISCRPYVLVPWRYFRVWAWRMMPNWPTGCRNGWACCSSATRQCCIVCCMILKKPARIKLCHIFYLWMCMLFYELVFPPIWMFFLTAAGKYVSLLKWGKLRNSLT